MITLKYFSRHSDYFLRRPIQRNNVQFKKVYTGRYGGRRFNNPWFGGRGGRGNFRRNKRFKKTVDELDRELDVNFKFYSK